MVTRVHVPVELHRHVHPTRSRVHAHRRRAKHGRQGRINILDENLAHVAAHPLIEHLTQETPITRRRGRTAGHAVPVLAVQQRRRSGPPAALSLGQVRGAHPLHNGNELQVSCPQLVTEIAVDPRPVRLIRGVDRAQDVRLHPRAGELLPAAHHHRVGAAPATIEAVGVVQGSGPVNRHAHQETVVREKARPLLGHQRPVGLQGVTHPLGGATVALAQFDEAFEKAETSQGGFPTLPQHRHLAVGTRLKERLHVALQGPLRHGLGPRVVQQLLRQEKTILTVQVAGRPRRLGDNRKRNPTSHEPPPSSANPDVRGVRSRSSSSGARCAAT